MNENAPPAYRYKPITIDAYLGDARRMIRGDGFQKVDAFVLLYVKAETQMRKLVMFLMRSEPHRFRHAEAAAYIDEGGSWSLGRFRNEFDALRPNGRGFFDEFRNSGVHEEGRQLYKKMLGEINQLRDRIFHGRSVADDDFTKFKQKKPYLDVQRWIELTAETMASRIGYDGVDHISNSLCGSAYEHRFSERASYAALVAYVKDEWQKSKTA